MVVITGGDVVGFADIGAVIGDIGGDVVVGGGGDGGLWCIIIMWVMSLMVRLMLMLRYVCGWL